MKDTDDMTVKKLKAEIAETEAKLAMLIDERNEMEVIMAIYDSILDGRNRAFPEKMIYSNLCVKYGYAVIENAMRRIAQHRAKINDVVNC